MHDQTDRGEQGFVLIMTMLILVVLTIIGMAALDTSTFEIQIAANDRWAKVAFNQADGGVYSTSKLIAEAIENDNEPSYNTVVYTGFSLERAGATVATPHPAGDFHNVVMGYSKTKKERYEDGDSPYDASPYNGAGSSAFPDLLIRPNGASAPEYAEVFITGRKAKMIAGGGVEFGAGAAGAGVGSGGGGAAVTFDVDIEGHGGNDSRASVSARYRKVLGSVGGL